jgi:uncharacterized protein
MSAENVATVRTAYEAFRRGDLGAVAEHFAEDAEWETPESLPLGGLVSGRDAIIENFSQIPSYWSAFSVDPEEYIDAGDHVIVTGVQSATGPGGSFESRYLHLFKLSDGKVVRGEFIGDTAKARDALGG